ncbi:hypothetical protein BH10BAC5_BH10BAC5_11860 [soil metagenome]
MKKINFFLALLCALVIFTGNTYSQSAEVTKTSGNNSYTPYYGTRNLAPDDDRAILYNNGPLINSAATIGGNACSIIRPPMTTLGAGHALSALIRVADDFVVPAGGWKIDSIYFYAYQTGSTLTSTMTSVNFQIWNGVPGAPGSVVVFGDTTTNRMTRTSFSNIYRNSDSANTTRPVMLNVVGLGTGVVLPPGTYWIDWQTGGTLASGPWVPPISITGVTTTGNARQKIAGAWADLIDAGSTTAQGLPFILHGTSITPPPNPTTWYEQITPVTGILYAVSAPDINNVWAAGAAGKVIKTTNGGTWTLASGNLPTDIIYAIWAFDANSCLVTTSPGATFTWKTTNGGTNWTQVFTQVGGFIDGFYFKDANNGLMMGDAVGGRSSIWKTTNAGTTWDSAGVNFATSDASWNNSMCGVGDVVYWGTNASKVYKSTNFGTNWAPTAATGEVNSDAVWFNDASNGMYGGNTLVQSTSNGGANWVTVTPPGTAGITFGITGTGTSNYWSTRAGNIYATTNAGVNWTNPVTSVAGTFQHITKSRSGSPYLYACRTNGTIAKYGGPFTGVTPISTVVDNYSLGQNYPNPFNPTTKITFSVPTTGLVTLKVYDMTGKETATLVNGQMSSGSYSVDFNASSLSSGIYFYSIQSGNFTDTKKMMLVK